MDLLHNPSSPLSALHNLRIATRRHLASRKACSPLLPAQKRIGSRIPGYPDCPRLIQSGRGLRPMRSDRCWGARRLFHSRRSRCRVIRMSRSVCRSARASDWARRGVRQMAARSMGSQLRAEHTSESTLASITDYRTHHPHPSPVRLVRNSVSRSPSLRAVSVPCPTSPIPTPPFLRSQPPTSPLLLPASHPPNRRSSRTSNRSKRHSSHLRAPSRDDSSLVTRACRWVMTRGNR